MTTTITKFELSAAVIFVIFVNVVNVVNGA
jgi:hypothetical protein